ncbi:arginyl-tRNA--protein transferase 1-like isoform X1 [Limulus polyphemus]|uniref:Arginyl-tRNA--protein transferase 1 n=1 Tax=Limulus polyphemus TaxID=6850 RepID=A0ABM1SFI2_LIMPO|nr:arginyl-tRNA--protein transferase 1-like isoform X1 [Limulus polyphemus]
MSEYSVVEYFPGHEGHRCGYCKSETTNFSNGMWAHALTVQDYQNLIDRGWRRSGKYCYKPTMEITCCPNYTIRCDSEAIKLTTSQKKVLKKVYNFLAFGRKSIQSDIKSSNTLDDVKSTDEPISDFPDSELVSKIAERTEKDDRNRIVWNKNEGIASCSNFLESSHLKPADSLKRKDDTDNFHPNQGATKSEKQSYSKSEIPKPGQGPDPTKPLCKKAKVLRREKKQQKLRKKVKGEDHEMKDQNSVNESKSLEDFLKAPLPENPAHRLEILLVQTSPPGVEFQRTFDESYSVYKKYQMTIHKDPPTKCPENQFLRFLVRNPFEVESKPNGPSCGYGSFHQQYWLDGKLIAVGVLDILVSCVSSVYFFYDPDYSFLSLGTYAALREIAFCRELHREAPGIRYYYMGFYIHSCPKMKYKGNYYPSFLLCPETYTWHPIEKCTPKLDISKYSRFEEDGTKEDTVGEVNYDEVLVLHKYKVMPYSLYRHIRVTADDDEVHQYARLVGKKCYSNILLYRS